MDDLARIPGRSHAGYRVAMGRRAMPRVLDPARTPRPHPHRHSCRVLSLASRMQFVDLVGWLASAVLIATLIRQIYKQWRSDQIQGVSRWLFIGQITASLLFILYNALVGNAVFIVSNALILATGITGYVLQRIKLKRLGDRA